MTLFTFSWFFSCVISLFLFKIWWCRKRSVTLDAFIQFFSCLSIKILVAFFPHLGILDFIILRPDRNISKILMKILCRPRSYRGLYLFYINKIKFFYKWFIYYLIMLLPNLTVIILYNYTDNINKYYFILLKLLSYKKYRARFI